MAGETLSVAGVANPSRLSLRPVASVALGITGCAAFCILVGLFGQFATKPLVVGVLDTGHLLLLGMAFSGGAVLARENRATGAVPVAALAGMISGVLLLCLVAAVRAANLRWMFVSLTPATLMQIGFGLPDLQATPVLALAGAAAAALGAGVVVAPRLPRQIVLGALGGVVVAGLLRELIRSLLNGFAGVEAWGFDYEGLLPGGAAAAAAIGVLAAVRPGGAGFSRRAPGVKLAARGLCLLALLALPALTNDFVAQVMLLVCLYTLMGLGLNIELGLAGLVDLGFVAFFAVGAYVVALLTNDATGHGGLMGFFAALPFSVLAAAAAGFLFGLPVLRVRGDYLAIATLGLGEIVRVLVLSDMLKPWLGGAQGIVNIPKPELFGVVLNSPTRLFYLTACMAALAGYVAFRLQHSGLGRRWLAVREDEDVAQALGINLVGVKLSAYTIGAGFAGLAGGIFAAMLGSVFPQSFQLLVSVNVLAILVVGGIGSLPGVVVGAAALIGAPEVLRDLGEYRYLIYGLVIIAVMRLKPEGLSPKVIRHREIP